MQLDQVFYAFDEDGDGKISAAELVRYMSAIGEELSLEDAKAVLESVDADGDGLLDLEEFTKLAEAEEEDERWRHLRAAYQMYENEEEGCITPRSLERMLNRLGWPRGIEDCRAMICRFDLDGDGVLSFEEFRIMMMFR